MKKLSCKEFSGLDCSFTAEGETDQEARQKLSEHRSQAHAKEAAATTPEEQKEMDAKIQKKAQWW